MRFHCVVLMAIFAAAHVSCAKLPLRSDERSALQRLREDYCQAVAEAWCARKDRCSHEVRWWWRESAHCVSTARDHCLALELVNNDGEGASRAEEWAKYQRFDTARRDACLAHAREAACGQFEGDCLERDFLIVGTSEREGLCHFDGHCANENDYCADDPLACGGTCRAPAALGEPCPSRVPCAKGTHCVDEVCAAMPGMDEPCPLGRCVEGATCVGGACRAQVGEGEACFYPEGPHCGPDLFCAQPDPSAPGTCRPMSEHGAEGSRCGVLCRPGLVCHRQTCKKPLLRFESCFDGSPPCERDTRCLEGRCFGDTLPGQTCGACVDVLLCARDPNAGPGTCVYPPIADGKTCSRSRDCADGRVCAPAASSAPAVCRARGGAGAFCQEDGQCDAAFFCVARDQICRERLLSGADCAAHPSSCVTDHFCSEPDATCRLRPGEGEDCSGSGGCRGDLQCDGSTCQPRSGPGEFCGWRSDGTGMSCAEGLRCDTLGTCAACPF